MAALALPAPPALSQEMQLRPNLGEGVVPLGPKKHHVPPLPAVPSEGPSEFHMRLPTERNLARATVTATHENARLVEEHPVGRALAPLVPLFALARLHDVHLPVVVDLINSFVLLGEIVGEAHFARVALLVVIEQAFHRGAPVHVVLVLLLFDLLPRHLLPGLTHAVLPDGPRRRGGGHNSPNRRHLPPLFRRRRRRKCHLHCSPPPSLRSAHRHRKACRS
mmetsp:Transcript_32458/g.77076  ORF Transcript_32458/g.77076 Transcript_32458/m.77076 type:complete len:221 (+) Transcript_32458:1281-1943(+)